MSKFQIITGLDIGSDTIKILSARARPKTEDLEVIFCEKIGSLGVQKGRVGNPKEASERISMLLERFPKNQDRIEQVFVNVNGSKIQLVPNHGLISVSPASQKVCQEDIDRILEETRKNINLPSNRDVYNIFPRSWTLDGELELKKPLGLKGVRLEVEAFLLSIFNLDVENVYEALSEAGLDGEDVMPSPLAAGNAVLDCRQKELGVAVLDIGACTSGLTVYEDGNLMDLAIFPVGSANITNDIAIGLKTEIDIAEKIKKEFSSCIGEKKTGKRKIEKKAKPVSVSIKGINKEILEEEVKKDHLDFSQKQVKKIIEARVDEIFELAQKELKKIGRQELLPAGIVLTGGGVNLPGTVDVSKKILKLPSRIGYAKGFIGLEKDCSLATVCGLVIESRKGEGSVNPFFPGREGSGVWRKMKNFLKPFIP